MNLFLRIIAPALLLVTAGTAPVSAHEFWIEPQRYQVPAGETIEARFRNGEKLEGVELAYFDRNAARHEMLHSQEVTPISSRSGDRPAIVIEDAPEGLVVLAHETKPSRLTYRDWEKFERFAAHKDFPDIAARHAARGLPTDLFRENYTRHAKALIGVGGAKGRDRALGMDTEFVALTNPYAATFMQKMTARLLYKGAPRGDAQVEIFERAPDGTVTITTTRTNAEGIAQIDTKPGHDYLLDAVVLRAPEYSDADIAWETLWAALTFAVPE